MADIDARLYSRAKSEMPVDAPTGGVDPSGSYTPPVRPVDVNAVPAGEATLQGKAIQQTAQLIAPNRLESLGATFNNSVMADAYRWLTKPEHEPDTKDSPQFADFLKQTPFELTQAEYDKLQSAKNAGDRQWYLDNFKRSRETSSVAGEFPLQHFVTAVGLDPSTYVGGFAASLAGRSIQAANAAKALSAARAAGPLSESMALNIATQAGLDSTRAARVAAAAAGGATEGAINAIAQETSPVSTGEAMLMVAAMTIGSATMVRNGKLVPRDPDYLARDMAESLSKPHMRMVEPAKHVTDNFGNEVKVRDAVWEEVPRAMRDNANATVQETAEAIEQTVDNQVKSWSKSFGEAVGWNVNKTMRKLSTTGDEAADLIVDNNSKYGLTSAESEKAAVRRELGVHQWKYEDEFRAELAQRGHGTLRQLTASRETRAASAALEDQIAREFWRRETLIRQGKEITSEGVDPAVYKLADAKGNVYKLALQEAKAAGVRGAEVIEHNPGYFPRVHSAARIEGVMDELMAGGLTEERARRQLVNLYRGSIRRANPGMSDEVADDIAGAMIDRARRKGMLEDTPRNGMFGVDTAAEVRDILKGSGIAGDRLQRAMDAMLGKVDEQGKASFLKHRIDMDYTATMAVNGRSVGVTDLLETNVNTIMDRYIDSMSAKVALAKKGLFTSSDIGALRSRYINGAADRKAAAELFDNVIAHLEGRPTGEKMAEFMRNAGAYSRMITLGASAIWQATEYATMAQRYGYLKTFKYAMAEMPLFKHLMETAATDKHLSRELKDVLTNQAEQSIRLRPFISRFEDNFDIPRNSQLAHAAQQGAQLVPYLNGMKLIHAHQARVQANLILDVLRKASHGDKHADDLLRGYGIESRGMDKLKQAIQTHGFSVDKWDDSVWRSVRPAFTKMVDEGVLHARMGDMPAYALFTQTGKFIFQYRSFVLTAHNKILAGTASRQGLGAVALMAMYQMPLSMMATQANEVASGRAPLETDKLIVKAIGQMGTLGGMTEVWNWLSGSKREVGATGLIPFDRTIRAAQSGTSAMFGEGDGGKAAKDLMSLAPLAAVVPGWKMLGALAENKD